HKSLSWDLKSLISPSGSEIEQDCEVVGDAAGQNEDVPGGVEVANAIECEKYDAERVSNSSCGKPRNTMPANRVNQRSRNEDDEPALEQVNQRRYDGGPATTEMIDSNAF